MEKENSGMVRTCHKIRIDCGGVCGLRNIEDIKLRRTRPPTYWHRSSKKIMAEKRLVKDDAQ